MEIHPYEALGDLRFGLTRQETLAVLGDKFETFHKGPTRCAPIHAYDDRGLHLYFDNDDRLDFIEGWGPATITFNGVRFLGRTPKAVNADMRALGHEPVRTEDGLQFNSAGIALWVEDGIVTSVGVFRRGYYDNLEETTNELIKEYEISHPTKQTLKPASNEVPAAEMRYCWRCRKDVPMLNDAAHAEIQSLWDEAIERGSRGPKSVDFDEEDELPDMQPAYRRYRELTGEEWQMRHFAPYHRLADLGPPCIHCGKPLRTQKATTCLECGKKQT